MVAGSYADVDALFGNGEVDAEDVELLGGAVVRVRGLTRYELLLNGKGTDDVVLIEARNVSTCMVAPPMTVEQAQHWQRSAPAAVLAPVVDAIRRLSGLAQGAQKSGVPADGERVA